jgi:hypothetical protein
MIIYKKPTKSESSKAAEHQPVITHITPYVLAASILHPVAGTCLMACSNADARHCARWILQYVESLKDAEADQEGNKYSFTVSRYLLFADFLILILVALTAHLEATEKALPEERAARPAINQSLAEEKVA